MQKRLIVIGVLAVAVACGTDKGLGPTQGTFRVSPDTLTIDPQQTVQFAAVDSSPQQGIATPVPSVTWSATGGTISSQGFFTADTSVRQYSITARDPNGRVANANIKAVHRVQKVVLLPAVASVSAGGTLQFRSYGLGRSGDSLSVTMAYSVTGGSITSAGLYSAGSSPGTYNVIATGSGFADTSVVTVTAVATAECATPRPEWIWCDDFEQDRLSSYFEYDAAGGNFTRTASVGLGGSTGMRAHWDAGQQSAGALHLAMGREASSYFRAVDAGTANYREIYWRMYVKDQVGWAGGGGDKLSRAIVFADGNWSEAAIAHVWSGISAGPDGNYLLIDPASGTDASGNLLTTGYNDFAHLSWLGQGHSVTPIFGGAHVGQWYCVEAHARLNTAGNTDGLFELWINGSLEAQRTELNFLGSYADYGINAVYFENYWNAGSVAPQERYFDNIVVSTARVGCLS